MHHLRLPEPVVPVPRFDTQWIADLDESIQADIRALLNFKEKIMSLDANTKISAAQKIDQAEILRVAAAPLIENLAPFFTRKPVPQSNVEYALFVLNSTTIQHLALIFLRAILPLARQKHEQLGFCVHRAAILVRYWQWQSWLAGRTPSAFSIDCLVALLEFAFKNDLLNYEKNDRAVPRQSKSSIGGQIAWALMMIAARPVRLNLAQVLVTQRVSGRWRELLRYRTQKVGSDSVSFGGLFAQAPNPLQLAWADFSGILRKIDHRIAALNRGETPAQLKLGTELDSAAAKRLLQLLKKRYQKMLSFPQVPPQDPRSAPCAIYFEAFNAFPTFVAGDGKPPAPAENWQQHGNFLWRDVKTSGARYLSPHLVASDSPARLGILSALCEDNFGGLFGTVAWFNQHIEVGSVLLDSKAVPAFLLQEDARQFLIVPFDSPLNLQKEYAATDLSSPALTPTELVERGADFLRYAVH